MVLGLIGNSGLFLGGFFLQRLHVPHLIPVAFSDFLRQT